MYSDISKICLICLADLKSIYFYLLLQEIWFNHTTRQKKSLSALTTWTSWVKNKVNICGILKVLDIYETTLLNYLLQTAYLFNHSVMTRLFIEQPLASPGSANNITFIVLQCVFHGMLTLIMNLILFYFVVFLFIAW